MADIVLSGGNYGGGMLDLAHFDGDTHTPNGYAAILDAADPKVLHIYRLSEDKLQAIFVGNSPAGSRYVPPK